MNNQKVKRLRKDVMVRMYADSEISEAEVRKGKHDIMKEPEFKRVFRARKKNEQKTVQVVKHMLTPDVFDPKLKQMRDVRVRKNETRKRNIRLRKKKR